MDDLRQKLFPIFLKEAGRNLAALRQFLGHADLSVATAEELETAFRAAHTLKGTANLVQAESICKISRRLEAMLEKHFEARTRPTPVEHEALKLAVDWLAPLVSALQGDLQEPKLFVAEALQALDLAEAFPGRTPLIELIDSHTEKRTPLLDDPFAGDPALLLEENELLQVSRDPFAEDPGFGMEIHMISPVPTMSSDNDGADEVSDPYAADHLLGVGLPVDESSEPANSVDKLPFDPFADDEFGFELDSVSEGTAATQKENFEEFSDEEPTVVLVEEGKDDNDAVVQNEYAAVVDPFADDEDFVDGPVASAEDYKDLGSFVSTTTTVAERAEEIAESLLLPHAETAPRRDYVCCIFSIGSRDYHLPIKQMVEIADVPQVLSLPLAPPMVSGLINLRGQVMPLVNLAILNNHQQSEVRLQRRLVVAEHQNETLAFLVDGVPFLAEDFSGEKVDMSQFLSLYRIRGSE